LDYSLHPLGDNGVIIELGSEINEDNHKKVKAISAYLNEHFPKGFIEFIPAYTTVTIFYDPLYFADFKKTHFLPFEQVCRELREILMNIQIHKTSPSKTIEIPVHYGGSFGPDLDYVACYNHLTMDEVVRIHSSCDYLVYMIGFAPGFPYLGGMSGKIAAPRRSSPRFKIPAGSVGIAGNQTGVYPIETPGGWQLIGRTPLTLFNPGMIPPSILSAGDKIRFKPITDQEFYDWGKRENA
jgi:inhibitor of KinA